MAIRSGFTAGLATLFHPSSYTVEYFFTNTPFFVLMALLGTYGFLWIAPSVWLLILFVAFIILREIYTSRIIADITLGMMLGESLLILIILFAVSTLLGSNIPPFNLIFFAVFGEAVASVVGVIARMTGKYSLSASSSR